MSSKLFKVEASGNDFLLGIGGWAQRLRGEGAPVVSLCDRRRGIGADGVLALDCVSPDRVRLVHRNSDGSEAAFCGNGTRCAARAAVELLGCRERLVVETGWAAIPAEVRGTQVSLELPAPPSPLQRHRLQVAGESVEGWSLTVGVPHMVVLVDDLGSLDLELVAPPLRRHPELGREGCNVDFAAEHGSQPLAVRTWERGVEAETLACGSGIVATALVVMARRHLRELSLRAVSGDELRVEALGEPPECPVRFTGDTRIVGEILPSDELLTP